METRELHFGSFAVRRAMALELFFMSTSIFEAVCATEYLLFGRMEGMYAVTVTREISF